MGREGVRRSWSFAGSKQLCLAVSQSSSDLNIIRLAPGNGKVELEFAYDEVDRTSEQLDYVVEWVELGNLDAPIRYSPGYERRTLSIGNLINGKDYAINVKAIASESGSVLACSPVRLVRPGNIPGTVINYIHPDDYTYGFSGRSPASPSITILPSGRILISHDVYWQKAGQNLTKIFQSEDGGQTWSFLCDLFPCFWGKLFQHNGSVYMLATSTEYGDLLIGRSDDGGQTWTPPTVIMKGGSREQGGPHKAPVPVIVYKGRIWSAVEYGSWSRGGHDPGVISAEMDADLLDPSSWTVTPFLTYDPGWSGTIKDGTAPSLLEGNVVISPDGELVNLLRYHTKGGIPEYGRAIMLNVNWAHPELPLTFRKTIDFIGNMSKFTIQFDPESKRYWSLVNRVTTPNIFQRNVLTLVSSTDLEHWEAHRDVLDYQNNGWPEDDKQVGFQYVDWHVLGEQLVFVSRTAIEGAFNYHNANYVTFHKLDGFREGAYQEGNGAHEARDSGRRLANDDYTVYGY